MGYTTVAAIGLVDRLEKLGYIARSICRGWSLESDGANHEKGWNLVATIRQDMIQCVITLLQDYLIAQEE